MSNRTSSAASSAQLQRGRHRTPRAVAGLAAVAAAITGFAVAAPAQAQQVVRMAVNSTGGPLGGMNRPAMTPGELETYAGILGLDETQHAAAKELLGSYTSEYEKASREQAEKMRQISEEFRETRDDEVWQQMGPVSEKFSKRGKELETSLLADLKAVCDDKQLAQWPKLERTRRRDRTIDRGTVSGESVDLVRIVRGLDLNSEAKAAVDPQIESYEQDLDRALESRNRILDEQMAAFSPGRGGPISFDLDAFQKQQREARDAGAKVRDVNQRFARSIEGLLPEAVRATFAAEVKRASFPMVYRQTRAQRAFDAAIKFNDIDDKQKEAITALRQGYEQEIASLNDKWASAILDEENDAGGVTGLGGGAVMISFGGDDEGKPSAAARKARRDADRKAVQSLESLLSPEQKERLPQFGDDSTAVGAPIRIMSPSGG